MGAGSERLRARGLPARFPAVTRRSSPGAGPAYYFAGDFADNPMHEVAVPFAGYLTARRWFEAMKLAPSEDSFYWCFYAPMMSRIIEGLPAHGGRPQAASRDLPMSRSGQTACLGTRTFDLALGCLEVPCDSHVVMTKSLGDAFLGNVEWPGDGRRVWWATGMWASQLEPAPGRRIVWSRSSIDGEDSIRYGLVDENGAQILIASSGRAEFTLAGSSEADLQFLLTVARGYRMDRRNIKCARPEIAARE